MQMLAGRQAGKDDSWLTHTWTCRQRHQLSCICAPGKGYYQWQEPGPRDQHCRYRDWRSAGCRGLGSAAVVGVPEIAGQAGVQQPGGADRGCSPFATQWACGAAGSAVSQIRACGSQCTAGAGVGAEAGGLDGPAWVGGAGACALGYVLIQGLTSVVLDAMLAVK